MEEPRKMLERKNTVKEMKNAFDRLSRVDTVEDRISKFDYFSMETSKTEVQTENKVEKKQKRIFKSVVKLQQV